MNPLSISRTPLLAVVAGACLAATTGCSSTSTPATSSSITSPAAATSATPGAGSASSSSSAGGSRQAPTTAAVPAPAGRAGTPRGGVVVVAQPTNAAQVAGAVAATMLRFDTALDHSPQDATRRATRWMTPDLAALQDAQTGAGGAWWTQLAAGRGWTSTTLVKDPEPAPTMPAGAGQQTFARYQVTVTPHVAAGAKAPAVQRYTVATRLTRPTPTAPWQVAQVQAQPLAGASS